MSQAERPEDIQEEREKQREWQAHQANWQTTQRQQLEAEKKQWLDKLMETGMSDAGIELLDNVADKAFILGNITEAEYHDEKWWLEVLKLRVYANFPPENSAITGDFRAFILDDRDENLEPLTGQQKTVIEQMFQGIKLLISRSKGGFQQEMNVKTITVSQVMNQDEEEDDRLLRGLFR